MSSDTPASGQERVPGVKIATVSGVPVYIGASWALLALVIIIVFGPSISSQRPDLGALAYGVAALYALLLLVAVLVHEAAHAVAARASGLPVLRVVADLWGGHTAFDSGRATPGSSALVAVVGPLANGFLALVGLLLWTAVPDGVPSGLAEAFAVLNAGLAAFNLLPGLPLDGGQLVEAGVWKFTRSRGRGRVAAGWCGRVVTALVLLWFVGRPLVEGSLDVVNVAWAAFIGMFMWAGASNAIAHGHAMQILDGIRLHDVIRPVAGMLASTPIAEALAHDVAPVVVDGQGTPIGIVAPEDLEQVPQAARATATVGSVSRTQPAGWVLEADPAGSLLPAIVRLQSLGTGVLAVSWQGRLAGVVTAADVNAAVERN